MLSKAACNRAAGSSTYGDFLFRLQFCQQKTTWEHGWSARTRQQWADEMGISLQSYDRARSRLLALGLIEAKQGIHKGVRKAFLRLSHREQIISSDNDKPEQIISSDSYIENKEVNLSEEVNGACSAAPEEVVKRPKQIQTRGLKAEQIAAAFSNAKLTPKEPEGTAPIPQSKQWRMAFHKTYPDLFLADLTLKQLGQLKLFWRKCPPNKAAKVMEWAVANWAEFCSTAQIEAGAFNMPMLPDIPFLLKFMQVAVNGMMKEEDVKAAKPVQALSNTHPKWQPEPKPQPVAQKATLEEVMSIVEGN